MQQTPVEHPGFITMALSMVSSSILGPLSPGFLHHSVIPSSLGHSNIRDLLLQEQVGLDCLGKQEAFGVGFGIVALFWYFLLPSVRPTLVLGHPLNYGLYLVLVYYYDYDIVLYPILGLDLYLVVFREP
uniref:Uncharacterized protein n=1 Tax=Cannabis sativa TaxID=3483 RepID=A0A803PYL4_CANSA